MNNQTRERSSILLVTMAGDFERLAKELRAHATHIGDPAHDKLAHPTQQIKQVVRKLNNISFAMYYDAITDILITSNT